MMAFDKKTVVKAIMLVGALAVLAVIYIRFDPAASCFFPKCPFKLLTGFDCPGCGSQRAIHHLLHLRIAEAFRANALLVAALPYILSAMYFDFFHPKGQTMQKIRHLLYGRIAIWALLFLTIGFWVGRNAFKF
ncbi:MAG: DUF2752 domain-containing protein [Dysgonamonadaceae bacterium]|jgi:hypothetical protein|nr:DUF2752 domain-containing protein [Dysgonamonadaceae bacterium]